jgi:prolyl 4-hydroxylase
MKKLHNQYEIYLIDNLILSNEIDFILNDISLYNFDISTVDLNSLCLNTRSSKTLWYPCFQNDIINDITRRVDKLLGTNHKTRDNGYQIVKYDKNDFFKPHYDPLFNQTNLRFWTLLFCLKSANKGGETYFPKINLKIKLERGQAILFRNIKNNKIIDEAIHSGEIVEEGEKIIMNLWINKQ